MKDIDFGVDFVAGSSNKLQKIGSFGWKNQLCPQCVHIAKGRKTKDVFTLGPRAQASLI